MRELDAQATTLPAQAAGGRLTLEDVYRAHARLVSRWIRLLDPGADTEDLLHEVFLVVGRRLGDFRGDSTLTTWLYAVTLRVVSGERRKRKLCGQCARVDDPLLAARRARRTRSHHADPVRARGATRP